MNKRQCLVTISGFPLELSLGTKRNPDHTQKMLPCSQNVLHFSVLNIVSVVCSFQKYSQINRKSHRTTYHHSLTSFLFFWRFLRQKNPYHVTLLTNHKASTVLSMYSFTSDRCTALTLGQKMLTETSPHRKRCYCRNNKVLLT